MGTGRASETGDSRAERLSRALRDNLLRRKAQARARLDPLQEAKGEAGPAAESGRET